MVDPGFNIPQNLYIGTSQYLDNGEISIHKGASIGPVGLTISNNSPDDIGDLRVKVTTDWGNMVFPHNWLHRTINTENVCPFLHFELYENCKMAICPVDLQGVLLPHHEAVFYNDCDNWFLLNGYYQAHGDHYRPTLIERINNWNGLQRQLPLEEFILNIPENLVLYPANGRRMRACRCRSGTYVVRDGLFYLTCRWPEEAAYLVAILNAPRLSEIFNVCRPVGRYYGLHPWRNIPIPVYDPANPLHQRLSNLTTNAEDVALTRVMEEMNGNQDLNQANHRAISNRINESLNAKDGIYNRINNAVDQLIPNLPNHVRRLWNEIQ